MYLSKKKERQLIKIYSNTEDKDVAKILGISEWLVRKVAEEQGLEKCDSVNRWNKINIEMLVKWYPDHDSDFIAYGLMRSKVEIEHQAFRLGLKKSKDFFGNIYSNDEERAMVKKWNDEYSSKENGNSRGNYVLGRILDYIYPRYTVIAEYPLGGLRIDWLIKELKIGFEFDGVQHTEFNSFHYETKYDFIKAQNRDYSKSLMAEKMGIAIVRFTHDEELSVELIRAKIREVL